MHDMTNDLAQGTRERPSTSIYLAAIAFLVWMVVPWWVILGTTAQGGLILAVCALFTLVAFGIAAICILTALHTRRPDGARRSQEAEDGAPRRLRILTGTLPMSEAALQILLIPGSVALGFTLFALVELLERT